jgi:hypothetical protein
MTNKLRHFRFGAVTAAAAMLVGVSAAAAGIYATTDPMAFTTRVHLNHATAEARAADRDIRSDWTAPIAEAMTVDMFPEVHDSGRWTAGTSQAALASAGEPAPEAACTPKWHGMAEGPAGRYVAAICPGKSLLPIPADTSYRPGLNVLPTLRVFASGLPKETLDPDVQPTQQPAVVAALRVGSDLTRDAERLAARHPEGPLPDSGTLIRDPAPLDWAPRVAQVRSSAGAPNQCRQGRTC